MGREEKARERLHFERRVVWTRKGKCSEADYRIVYT